MIIESNYQKWSGKRKEKKKKTQPYCHMSKLILNIITGKLSFLKDAFSSFQIIILVCINMACLLDYTQIMPIIRYTTMVIKIR